MKYIVVLLCLFGTTVYAQNIPQMNRPEHNRNINTVRLDSISGNATSYYLNHSDIDAFSKAFYKGEFALYDNDETFGLMDSILTNNNDTRPFYLYNFCRMMDLSNGAVSEMIAEYCNEYYKKFTCELHKLDQKENKTTITSMGCNDWIYFRQSNLQ